MKRLVICLDGTWNNPEMERSAAGRTRYKPTNVLKIFRAVRPSGRDGTAQIAFYLEGVGAFVGEPTRFARLQKLADRLLGGAFGGGFEARVKAAYRFLVANHEPGDAIYLFGFSRGAAQAHSLARFVDWVGGLLAKPDEYYIPELFAAFRRSRARPGAAAQVIAAIRARRPDDPGALADPRPVEIELLGLFDTVLALGSRLRADRGEQGVPTVEWRNSFHVGSTPPPIVRAACQALAIDEKRWDFRPQIWERAASPQQSLEQRWFPGVHSNIGGGYELDGLANFALYWMLSEAKGHGLELDSDYLAHFRPNPKGARPESLSRPMALLELLRGKRGRGRRALSARGGATLSIDPSAVRLLLEDPTYRPANLLSALAEQPELLAVLSASERAAVAGLLGDRPAQPGR